MSDGKRRRFLVGDSIWCGGAACALLLLMDIVAAMKGGRTEVPAGVIWTAVAGVLLPFLNLYFIGRDLFAGHRRDAAIGLALSILALVMAFDPPWKRFVILAGREGDRESPYVNVASGSMDGERWRPTKFARVCRERLSALFVVGLTDM